MKNTSVDLIVLDMIMDPGINGRETYERIINLHPNQKAIIASGFSETEDVKAAQELGAGQYIKKPYTLEKIGVAVRDELKDQLRDRPAPSFVITNCRVVQAEASKPKCRRIDFGTPCPSACCVGCMFYK